MVLVMLTGPYTRAEAHFAAQHRHTGTVLHIVYENFGFVTTLVEGKNRYVQNLTTVKQPAHRKHLCDQNGLWVILSCTYSMENLTGHVGMFTYGDFYSPSSGLRYTQRAHFHAFGQAQGGGWGVSCAILNGSLPPGWYDTCSGSRS